MNTQKLKVSKEDRRLVEAFMGYGDGDLPEFVDWNIVMPVVEKIEGVGQTYCLIGRICCKIQPILYDRSKDEMKYHALIEVVSNIKIVAAWRSVVQFIEWYNQQSAAPKQ